MDREVELKRIELAAQWQRRLLVLGGVVLVALTLVLIFAPESTKAVLLALVFAWVAL